MLWFASSLAFASQPELLDVRIGLAPAELAHIQIPATPGSYTRRVVSGVELDVTVFVFPADEGLELTFAVMPASRRFRGVDGDVGDLMQHYVRRDQWPQAVGRQAVPYPSSGWGELFQGGFYTHEDGTRTDYGVKVVLGNIPDATLERLNGPW